MSKPLGELAVKIFADGADKMSMVELAKDPVIKGFTTNPTLILKASQMEAYKDLVDEAIAWGKKAGAKPGQVTDRLAVNFGAALTKIVPGRVSTEVDADLSFDTQATVAKARALIAAYKERGVERERILAQKDSSRLERWLATAAVASSLGEVIEEPS